MLLQSTSAVISTQSSFLLQLLFITSQIRLFPVLMTLLSFLCSSSDIDWKQQSKHCHYCGQETNKIWRPSNKKCCIWGSELSWRCPGLPCYPIRKTLLGNGCVWKRCLGSGIKWWKLPLQSDISFKCWKMPKSFISFGYQQWLTLST